MKIDDVIDLIEAELDGSDDGEPNELKNNPSQDPQKLIRQTTDDVVGNAINLDEEPDEEEDYESQYDEKGIASEMVDMLLLDQDSAYQTYFRGVMKKHGVTGIKHMNNDKKREFFKDVSNGWKKHKKVKESVSISEDVLYEEYKKYFQHMLEECGIDDFDMLSEVDQAEFMSLVNEAFQTMNELMQKPGQGYDQGMMNTPQPKRPKPVERLKHSGAALAMRQAPTKMYAAGQKARI